jgi:hypothetical protein
MCLRRVLQYNHVATRTVLEGYLSSALWVFRYDFYVVFFSALSWEVRHAQTIASGSPPVCDEYILSVLVRRPYQLLCDETVHATGCDETVHATGQPFIPTMVA